MKIKIVVTVVVAVGFIVGLMFYLSPHIHDSKSIKQDVISALSKIELPEMYDYDTGEIVGFKKYDIEIIGTFYTQHDGNRVVIFTADAKYENDWWDGNGDNCYTLVKKGTSDPNVYLSDLVTNVDQFEWR